MGIKEIHDADIRRTIIQLLAYDTDYQLSDSILLSALDEVGKSTTHDQLINHCLWMADMRLVAMTKIDQHLTLVRLTDKGLEIAKGKARIHGVRDLRPSELHDIGQSRL